MENIKPPILIGPTGVGKTHLLYAMGKAITDNVNLANREIYKKLTEICMVEYLPAPGAKVVSGIDILNDIKDGFSDNSSHSVLTGYQNRNILMIDDFGAEKESTWTPEQIYLILNHRLAYCKRTVVSTNLSLDEIAKKYGDRIISRLRELCHPIVLKGEDRRVRKEK